MGTARLRYSKKRKTAKRKEFYWVDYFCLRQLKNDFKTQQVEELTAELQEGRWVHTLATRRNAQLKAGGG